MNLNKLYDVAEKEKIYVKEMRLNEAKGMYITCNDIDVILLNKNDIKTNREELCVLAEELGHYYCNANYPLECTDKTLIDKAEYRATKYAFKTLINKERLIALSKQNLSKYEIAEELEVTEELLEKAYNYYMYN